MKEVEVRVVNKSLAIFGFFGAILLAGILYYIGTKIEFASQQTYTIVIGLSVYTVIMYNFYLKKSKLMQICISKDLRIIIREDDKVLQDTGTVNCYYYKNFIPKKFGSLLQIKSDRKSYLYYIVSKDLMQYTGYDTENISNLIGMFDAVYKSKKSRNLLIDIVTFLPLLIILISVATVKGFILYAIFI